MATVTEAKRLESLNFFRLKIDITVLRFDPPLAAVNGGVGREKRRENTHQKATFALFKLRILQIIYIELNTQ